MIGNSITERIGVHKVALCFLEKFGWIEREQYVADHGIDTQVEIIEDEEPTGLLYCIQVKAGESYIHTSTDNITYYPKERHVDYWLNHSLPVVLVLCDLQSETMYWNFVTRKTVFKTKKGWKIDIPTENQLGDDKSLDKIRNFYFSNDNFTIMKSGIDNSHALSRRIAMKIVLKRDTSNVIIEKQLPKLIDSLKVSDYYRSGIVENRFRDQPADCVWIWFYRNHEQYINGLPFCTACWNHPDSESPTILHGHDKVIDDIFIKYAESEIPDEMISRRLPKGKYLKIVDHFLSVTNHICTNISEAHASYKSYGNMSLLKRDILKYKKQFEDLLPEEYRLGYAPVECTDLDQIVQNVNALIGNIFVVVGDNKRDDKNVISCIGMYLKDYGEQIGPAKYERNKVI